MLRGGLNSGSTVNGIDYVTFLGIMCTFYVEIHEMLLHLYMDKHENLRPSNLIYPERAERHKNLKYIIVNQRVK